MRTGNHLGRLWTKEDAMGTALVAEQNGIQKNGGPGSAD
jgi:hypothetical protein